MELILKTSLLHCCKDERREALAMLSCIGLTVYFQEFGDTVIDSILLRELYEVFQSKLEDGLSKIQERKDGNKSKLKGATPRGNIKRDSRISRPDAMIHFPFVDACGTVDDILTPSDESFPKYLSMGEPAQRRLATRIFEELKSGGAGLSVSDIPLAIKSLGLPITPRLEKAFAGYFSSNKDKSKSYSRETSISLEKWLRVVKKYVRLVLSSPNNLTETSMSMDEEDESDYESNDEDNDNENDNDDDDNYDESSALGSLDLHEVMSSKPKSKSTSPVVGFHRETETSTKKKVSPSEHHTRILKAESRIKNEIRRDRSNYNRNQRLEDHHAYRTLAQRKCQIPSNSSSTSPFALENPENSLKDGNTFRRKSREMSMAWNGPKSTVASTSSPSSLSTLATAMKTSKFHKKDPLGRYKDLTSGSSALEIANAFLYGEVGQEFARQSELPPNFSSFRYNDDDHHNRMTNQEEVQRNSERAWISDILKDDNGRYEDPGSSLSLKAAVESDTWPVDHPLPSKNRIPMAFSTSSAVPSTTMSTMATASASSMATKAALLENPKSVSGGSNDGSASAWTSRAGGWVADFGPPRSHRYSLLPEKYCSTSELGIKPWHRVSLEEDVHDQHDDPLEREFTQKLSLNNSSPLQNHVSYKSNQDQGFNEKSHSHQSNEALLDRTTKWATSGPSSFHSSMITASDSLPYRTSSSSDVAWLEQQQSSSSNELSNTGITNTVSLLTPMSASDPLAVSTSSTSSRSSSSFEDGTPVDRATSTLAASSSSLPSSMPVKESSSSPIIAAASSSYPSFNSNSKLSSESRLSPIHTKESMTVVDRSQLVISPSNSDSSSNISAEAGAGDSMMTLSSP